VEQVQVGEHVGDPNPGGVRRRSGTDLGERDRFTDRVDVEHDG